MGGVRAGARSGGHGDGLRRRRPVRPGGARARRHGDRAGRRGRGLRAAGGRASTRCAPRPPAAPGSPRSARARSCSPPPGCSTAAARRRTGSTRRGSPASTPRVTVEPDVLYVDEGDVLTSAGVAAGIDLCLHLVRRDHGAEVANAVARRMCVAAHREGGQAQFVERPLPDAAGGGLAATREWMEERLGEPLTVAAMARHAGYSPRSFARRFRAETGTTPLQWLIARRVREAQRLLEASALRDRGDRRCAAGSGARRAAAALRARASGRRRRRTGARSAPPRRRSAESPRAYHGRHGQRAVDLPPRDRRVPRGRRAAGAAPRARDRRRAARRCCSCSSTRRSTRSGRRSEPGDLPFGPDFWRARGIDVVADAARRQADLPRAGPARRLPDHAGARHPRVHRHDGGRARRRARRGGDRGARARPRGAAVHRRVGRGPQDRVDRRPRLARRLLARVRGQRRQRRRAVPPGHGVRAARRADDVGRAGDRGAAACPASASASPTPSRARTGCASGSCTRRAWRPARAPVAA